MSCIRRTFQRRVALSVSVGALSVLMLAGCATTSGGAMGTFSRAAVQASSALSTAQLTFQLYTTDRSTNGVTDTALKDSLKELLDAEQQVEDASPQTDAEVATQAESLKQIRAAANDVIAAQLAVSGTSSDDPTQSLSAQDAALNDLRQQLEPYK
jgi:hypothetical protein